MFIMTFALYNLEGQMETEDNMKKKVKLHIRRETHKEDLLSGVQSVKSGTKRGTLSIFFK